MKLIFYISVFNILMLVKTEIRPNNRPKLRWKGKIIRKGDKFRRVGGPRAYVQFHPINGRRIADVQEREGTLVTVRLDRMHRCQQKAINSDAQSFVICNIAHMSLHCGGI